MKNILITFPGQGSQFVGMGKKFFDGSYREIAEGYFNQASEILGFDTKALCFHGPVEELTLTYNTQPLIVTISSIYGEIIKKELSQNSDINFITMGHSVGEYSALVFTQALSFKSAIELTKARGHYMQKSYQGPSSSMIAILGAKAQNIEEACKKSSSLTSQVVSIANYNSTSQIVISGTSIACDKAIEILNELEVDKFRSIPLNVSAPFHCALMQEAQNQFEVDLSKVQFNKLKYPYIPNILAKASSDESKIAQSLSEQITAPVLWTQSVQNLGEDVQGCIDCGPGTVTAGLMKRINRGLPMIKLGSSTVEAIPQLLQSFIKDLN